jgi:hypothetical protein
MKTMKALLLFSIVLCSICITLFSCKKEDQVEEFDLCSLDTSLAGLAEWAYFKQGSTWVYRDLVSGRTKTMFVDEAYYFIDRWGELGFANYLRTSGKDGGYTWGYSSDSEIACNTGKLCKCKGIIMASSESGEMGGTSLVLPFFHFEGQEFGGHVPIGKPWALNQVESISDRLEFMGKEYSDLVRVHINYHPCADWTESRFWWKKNLGLVRFDYPEHNEIWMLVDYNVEQ